MRRLAAQAGFPLGVFFALFLCAGVGWNRPWVSPDTASYLDPGGWPEAWGRSRHPLYGWVLGLLPPAGVVWLQAGLIGAAALALARAVSASAVARQMLFWALLFSNLVLLWANALIPEVPGVAFALLGLAAMLRLAGGGRWWLAVGYGVALGLAVSLRPSLLPAVGVFPLMAALLARRAGRPEGQPEGRPAWRVALVLLIAGAVPVLGTAELRRQAVGDFNLVSFGGFQMAGMAGLMLDAGVVARLEGRVREDGEAILALRERLEVAGRVIATPENSLGVRSFTSAAPGYFDLYARTHDTLLYEGIATLQGGQDWVGFNRRMQGFALAVIRAAPERYAAWVVGASARAVGRLIVTNLPFMLGVLALAVLLPLAGWRGWRLAPDPDTPVLLTLALGWSLAAGGLAVLTTFPAARYLDTAGLLLPVLPIHLALRLWAARH